ncbi:hypothetical protein [Bradyrhizobium sp. SZCCHNRI2049]|uniref:hypothetical protein n=1 Tax=Bradyrhizobium sp. SZCCHNRI2049 TaxID=3057287 RepID=UPI0029162C13|nr:hypothetical protein [Bradyrhizobium sp. SZCCHNRI2049]
MFSTNEDNKKLADLVEVAAPKCWCESFSVGQGSPGPVRHDEMLHRILSSPRDYDPEDGTISEQPFRKVYANGLSVWREAGPDDDVTALMEESLWRREMDPVRQIHGVLQASSADLRKIELSEGERCFCVYDQTVSRRDPVQAPVATHATVMLRVPPKGTEGRQIIQKDLAGKLKEIFERQFTPASQYKHGLCETLNNRSAAGEFVQEAPKKDN